LSEQPGRVDVTMLTVLAADRLRVSRSRESSNTGTRCNRISSSSPASRYCWAMFAPWSTTVLSPAATSAHARALLMPSSTKVNVVLPLVTAPVPRA
jgi:hypothetical protein